MDDPGVDIRPLRQITGEAEFNEVFLTDVRIPDANRLGAVGQGWEVANATLNSERVHVGGGDAARESGMIGVVARTWREQPELRHPAGWRPTASGVDPRTSPPDRGTRRQK